MRTETSELYCVNCGHELLPFITTDDRNEGYCSNHSCNFSTNYDQNYHIAWYYYRNHGENIEGFRFYDVEKTIEDVETIKSTTYTTCLKF